MGKQNGHIGLLPLLESVSLIKRKWKVMISIKTNYYPFQVPRKLVFAKIISN